MTKRDLLSTYYEPVEIPYPPGTILYRVIKDKRVKEPHECVVTGYWIGMNKSLSHMHIARFVAGEMDYSWCVVLTEVDKYFCKNKEDAIEMMKGR